MQAHQITMTGTDPNYYFAIKLDTTADNFDAALEGVRGIVSSRYDQRTRRWLVPATPCGCAEIIDMNDDDQFWNWDERIDALMPYPSADDSHLYRLTRWQTNIENWAEVKPGECPAPVDEKMESWEHQRKAWALSHRREAVLLALEMGCGKTKTAIDIIETTKTPMRPWPLNNGVGQDGEDGDDHDILDLFPVLIVAPLSVLPVWEAQIEMHSRGDLRPLVLRGTVAQKAKQLEKTFTMSHYPNAIIVNYESLWREPLASLILSMDWGWVILDEAHKIKSPGSKVSRFCARLAPCSHRRLALTGTPMPHSPLDVYGIFRFLDVGLFGSSFAKFRGEFATMGGFQDKQVVAHRNLDKLAGMMDRITFSCKAADVLDLPPTQDIEHPVELSTKEYRAYMEMEGDFVAWLEEAGENIVASNALAKIIRLQQITSGYLPIPSSEFDQVEQIGTSKADALRDLLEGIDEPAAVFCKFRHDLATVQRIADSLGRKYCEVSGTRKDIDTGRWTEDQGDIAGIQIQAGGLGIDLTRARYGIYYSPSHSLGDYLQSRARLHRPGQDRPVTFIQLVGRQTIDEAIYQALAKKEKVIESVIKELSPVTMSSK